MGVFEIISAIILIIACVFIVVVILMKDTKTHMSQTISGTSSDSFFQKNSGRTKEAMLNRATITAAVIFFVLAIAVNVINVYGKKAETNGTTSSVTDTDHDHDHDDEHETSDTSSETSDTSNTSDTSAATSDTSGTSDTSAAASDTSGAESSETASE